MNSIQTEKSDGIGWIRIHRPEKKNALDQPTWMALGDAVREMNRDHAITVVIITGTGDAFASGADIPWLRRRNYLDILEYNGQDVLQMIDESPKIFLAAINGNAFGGGSEIALTCDLRYIADTALIGQLEINLGIIPSAGATQRLGKIVGMGRAKELILTGRAVDAGFAERIGLVNGVFPAPDLLREVEKIGRKIAAKAPIALRLSKALIGSSFSTEIHTGLYMERLAQTIAFSTEDRSEGMDSFLEKRKPVFRGK